MANIDVRPVKDNELAQAKEWILHNHYLGGWPKAVQAVLGVFADGRMVGTLVYGIGTRGQAAREIFQNEGGSPIMANNQMWELQRAFTTDEAKKQIPNLGSMTISKGNDFIRQHAKTKDGKPVKAIVSYADSSAGHKGSVYQSTNATYLGEQRPLPYFIISDPKTDNFVSRKQQLSQYARAELAKRGYIIKREMPPRGKHKFVYALGKDQSERDQILSKIVKPIFDYPKEGESQHQISNVAKERLQKRQVSQPIQQEPQSKRETIKKLLNSKVKNPETGNDILVRTALKYDKNHPSYKQAMGMTRAYAKKHNINLKLDR